jgi:hypothetical protein
MQRGLPQPWGVGVEFRRKSLKSELVDHLTAAGDIQALVDLRRLTETGVDDAISRVRPCRRLEQEDTADPENGRMIG